MPITKTFVAHETARRIRRQGLTTGETLLRLRTVAGVSLQDLSQVTGIHKSHIARIEAGLANPSLPVLTALGVALGADLSVRYFAGVGPRLHDRFQAPMVEALLRSLDTRWRVELEVPITRPVRGVIDVVITDRRSGIVIACEVQSELRRLEEQIRWSHEKADGLALRTGGSEAIVPVSRLLVLRSTRATREIARAFRATLATEYPAAAHDAILAMTTPSVAWPGPALVWMRQDGRATSLMAHPPPTISVGR